MPHSFDDSAGTPGSIPSIRRSFDNPSIRRSFDNPGAFVKPDRDPRNSCPAQVSNRNLLSPSRPQSVPGGLGRPREVVPKERRSAQFGSYPHTALPTYGERLQLIKQAACPRFPGPRPGSVPGSGARGQGVDRWSQSQRPGSGPRPGSVPGTSLTPRTSWLDAFTPREADGDTEKPTGAIEEDPGAQGSHFRFHFEKDLPEYGHMDVFCDWDKDPTLDTSEFAKSMRYAVRMRYSRSNYGPEQNKDIKSGVEKRNWFQKFCESSQIDIAELSTFVKSLTPKSVSDMKPMIVLLQGVLDILLTRQSDFVSAPLQKELAALKKRMVEYEQVVESYEGSEQKKRRAQLKQNWKSSYKTVTFQNKFGGVKTSEALEAEKERSKAMASEALFNAEKSENLEQKTNNALTSMRKAHSELAQEKGQKIDLQKDLDRKNKEIFTLSQRIEQQDRLLLEKEKQLKGWAEMETELEKIKSQKKLLSMKNAVVDQENEELRGQILALEVQANGSPFLPWMLFRPVVEYEWAAKMTLGMTTITVPANSSITLPQEGLLPWHVADLPAGSLITLPKEDASADAALPWNALVIFPGGEELGNLVVPGGTSLILPEGVNKNGKQLMHTVGIQAGTVIHVKGPESGTMDEDVRRTSTDIDHQMVEGQSEIIVGEGKTLTEHTVPGGSTIIMPFGARTLAMVPTKTHLMVPMGSNRMVRMPAGSMVRLHAYEQNQVVLLPARSMIKLPAEHLVPSKRFVPRSERHDPSLANSFTLLLPHASKVELPPTFTHEGLAWVTVADGTKIVTPPHAPLDAWEKNVDILPGNTETVSGGLHKRLRLCPCSVLTLPPAMESTSELLAENFKNMGPEASGMAIAGICPFLAAEALMLVPADYAAQILTLARPVAASKVVRRLKGTESAAILEHAGDMVVGAIAGYLDIDDANEKLNEFFGDDPKRFKGILECMRTWKKSEVAVNQKNIPIRKVVDALQMLPVREGSMLLASADSKRAAFSLMRMCSRSELQAAGMMEQLTAMSSRMAQLGTRYKEQDMYRAHLLSRVAEEKSETRMLSRAKKLLSFIKEAYGVATTLCRESPLDWQKEDSKNAMVNIKIGKTVTNWVKVVAEIQLEDDELPDNTDTTTEDMLYQELDIVCSTEDVTWGQGIKVLKKWHNVKIKSKQEKSNSIEASREAASEVLNVPKKLSSGLQVSLTAKALHDAVSEAFRTKDVVRQGLLFVVPIFVPGSGRPWGTITHINKMSTATEILGGILRMPLKNSIPLAMENLNLCSRAIALAVGQAEKHLLQRGAVEAEEALNRVMLKSGTTQDTVDHVAWLIDQYNKRHRKLVDGFTVTNRSRTLQIMREMKESEGTSLPVRKTIIALLLSLGLTERLEPFLGADFSHYPEDDSDLWRCARKNIVLNPHHPGFIIRMLRNSDNGIIDGYEVETTIAQALDALLEDVAVTDYEDAPVKNVAHMRDVHEFVSTSTKSMKLKRLLEEMIGDEE